MKTIRHSATLFYYDGPQVFEARDGIGGHYVAVLVGPEGGQDSYLVAGVAPERLRQFRNGTLDLRSLLSEENEGEWFLASADRGWDQPLNLTPQSRSLAASGLLPDAGFILHDFPAEPQTLQEARDRNNLVLEIAVDPPEAAEEHRIRVGTLSGLLGNVQMLIKHAYGAARRDLSVPSRRRIDHSNAHLMDVVIPAAAGSFRIVLEAVRRPDLLGQSELYRALERVDALFEHAGDPSRGLATVKEHKGHLAGAYLRLLRFLVEHKTGLRYSWAEPTFSKPNTRSISEAEARPLVDALSGVSNLGAEPVILDGALEKADAVNGTWRLVTSDEKHAGKTKNGEPSLLGLKIGGNYQFNCLEEIEEVEGTGREQRTLYLMEYVSL